MSGIVGLFNLDGRPVAPPELKGLAAALAHRAVDGVDFWVGSSVGLGHQHGHVTRASLSECQPLVSPSGVAVAFDGRLDNRREILDALSSPGRSPEAARSDAALVLASYEQFGEGFAAHLNGDFALALFDTVNRRLSLARDRMGARALYYCSLPRTLLFASEIKSILAHPAVTARPDEDALAEVVLEGYTDGRRTCFQNVCSVPPGHVVVAASDGLVVRPHWDFDPSREIRFGSFDEYVDGFRVLFAEAVRRRLRGAHPIAVSVSGGVDSSSILCQASTLIVNGARPGRLRGMALTFPGDRAADEIAHLDQVEQALHLPIERRPVTSLRLLTEATDRAIWHMEIPGLVWDADAALAEAARHSGCAVLLDGFFGDQILADQAYLVDLACRGHWLTLRRHLRQGAAWMTDVEPGLLGRDLRHGLVRALPPRWLFRIVKRRTVRRRFRSDLPAWYSEKFLARAVERSLSRAGLDGRFPSQHAAQLYRSATSGFCQVQLLRTSATGRMHGLEVAYPFRDRDLLAFLMAVPGEVINQNGVPKALLRHAMRGILPDGVRLRRWKADFTGAVNRATVAEFAAIRELLSRDCLAAQAGFVDGSHLARHLTILESRVARSDSAVPAWQVADVAGLELWLRRFWTKPR
jgi:asparagine synthase (glutamine-hydrolysing)